MPSRRLLLRRLLAVAAAASTVVAGSAAAGAAGTVHPGRAVKTSVVHQHDAAAVANLQRSLAAAFTGMDTFAYVDSGGYLGTLWNYGGTIAVTPASNEKLLSVGTALARLGPGYRFTTNVVTDALAPPSGGVLQGNVALVGAGDPTLTSAQLGTLADQIHARGIGTVTGDLLVDPTHFDGVHGAPGWQGYYLTQESGTLSALMVDHNQRSTSSSYVLHPEDANAALFKQILAQHGVAVRGPARTAHIATRGTIGTVTSAPLSTIAAQTLLPSDNTYAEMLLKQVGWVTGHGGSTAGGAAAVRDLATGVYGIGLGPVVDGSGLSSGDEESPQTLVRWLEAMNGSAVANPFIGGLPTACASGTLQKRLCGSATAGRVHAKTGTVPNVAALSGYVLDGNGHQVWFSFIVQGVPSSQGAAAIDRAVTALATFAPPV